MLFWIHVRAGQAIQLMSNAVRDYWERTSFDIATQQFYSDLYGFVP